MSSKKTAAVIIGATGGIGSAMLNILELDPEIHKIFAVSRNKQAMQSSSSAKVCHLQSDASDQSISAACLKIHEANVSLRYVVIATGVLHDSKRNITPEKRINDLKYESLHDVYHTNTFMPLIWIKELRQSLDKHTPTTIAVLSARVGSISDNNLGGWYSYRSSKAALNMLLKSLSVEFYRHYPKAKLISFHPGTTDTPLSKPFHKNIPKEKILSTKFVAEQLHQVLRESTPDGVLSFLDWQHQSIDW